MSFTFFQANQSAKNCIHFQDLIYEEKLKEAMDLASQKSAAGRAGALDSLCRAFCKKYVPGTVNTRYTGTVGLRIPDFQWQKVVSYKVSDMYPLVDS